MDTMNVFSYCDISSVFTTKTIDQIISPMAVQLCHLIISMECDGAKDTVISADLELVAENLSKATEHFSHTTVRLGAECDDGVLKHELNQAAKAILISGKNILLAVQKVNIQPKFHKHQEELISTAQCILLGTLKILQLEDDASVRKILQAIDWLQDCLTFIQTAEDMSHLVTFFREFSEALLLVNSLTERRIIELKDSLHQDHLSQTLQSLKKCVPMLYTATQSTIKHPQNEQMIASKWYIFDLTSKTIQKLKLMLTNGTVKQEQVKKGGSFFQQIYHLHKIINNPSQLLNSDLDFLVGAIVFYSMFVADCSRPNIKLILVKHCQHLLDLRKKLSDHLVGFQEYTFSRRMQGGLEQISASLKAELDNLNKTLFLAIFYQILDTFTDAQDPLKKLLKAILKTNKKKDFHPQNLFASKALQLLLQTFQNHTDQLIRVASLVLAKCPKAKTIEEIQSSIDSLCTIRDAVVGLLIDTSKVHSEMKIFERAQSIYQKWVQTTECLVMNFDGMLTVHEFLELSIREIEQNKHNCEKLLKRQEIEAFHNRAADICGLTKHIVQVVNRYVDQNKDPIFRNGLRVLVRQLENSVLDTQTAIIKCVEKISCVRSQTSFIERMKHLLDALYNVQEGVNGNKHPQLLSPLRTEVHPVDTKPMIIDLNELGELQEVMAKNGQEHIAHLASYESYLSKPLPLSATPENAVIDSLDTVNMRCLDLQPALKEILKAIRKHDLKKVSACCSFLLDIANTYIELAKVSFPLLEETNNLIKYKDIETLISYFVHFSSEGAVKSIYSMDKLIQTAVLLSHRLEEIKKCLISLADYWYSFAHQLFYTPADVSSNTPIFSRTMESLTAIVQLISESFSTCHDDNKISVFSANQETLDKLLAQLNKSQITANHLLNKAINHGFQTDSDKLEHTCIHWSVSIQQLVKSIDKIIEIDTLFDSESVALTKENICDSNSLLQLCQTSLWLQEAAALTIHKYTEENARNIGLLKEEVASLTEAIFNVKDNLNNTSVTASFLTVEYVLLQRKLTLKVKLLIYHMKIIYMENRGSLLNVVNIAMLAANTSNNDKMAIRRNFVNESSILVENIKLVNETLKSSLNIRKHEDVTHLAEHLIFLTTDIIARTGAFLENQQRWDISMLEAISLNWSAKAHQLILHLQNDMGIDTMTLTFIKQCLQIWEQPGTQITDTSVSLESEKQNSKPLSSIEIDLCKQQVDISNKQKASAEKEKEDINGHKNNALHEGIASCGENLSDFNKNKSSNIIQNKSISKPQKVAKETQKEANEQRTAICRSKKSFNRKRILDVSRKQESYSDKPLEKSFVEQTHNKESDKVITETKNEIKREQHKSINQKISLTPNENQKETSDAESTGALSEREQKEINQEQQESTNQKLIVALNREKWNSSCEKPQVVHNKDLQDCACEVTQMSIILNQETNCVKPQVARTKEKKLTVFRKQQKMTSTSQQDVQSSSQLYREVKCPLAEEVEIWEGESNTVVQVTKEMATHMSYMIQYLNREGPIQTTDHLIASARSIAAYGQTFVKFVKIMAKNCTDRRSSAQLLCGMEQIQTISNQLNIISSVKAATGCDDSAGEDVLVKNSQNLIQSVLQTWKAAEAACIKVPGNHSYDKDEEDVAIFCTQLRKKLLSERSKSVANTT